MKHILQLHKEQKPSVLGNILFEPGAVFGLDNPFYLDLRPENRVIIRLKLNAVATGPQALSAISTHLLLSLSYTLHLLEYLRTSNYIIVQYNQFPVVQVLGMVDASGGYADYDYLSPELQLQVSMYSSAVIIPTQRFHDLAENGFRDEDELRLQRDLEQFRKTFRVSKFALGISIVSAIVAVGSLAIDRLVSPTASITGKVEMVLESDQMEVVERIESHLRPKCSAICPRSHTN